MLKTTLFALTGVAALTIGMSYVPTASAGCGTCETSKDHAHEEKSTVVDIAAGNEDFSTLVAAIQAAGLAETLNGEGPFTVFAPTNEAFAALPEGTLEELLKPENNDRLISILTYHVVPGKVMAADVVKLTEATTVQGSNIDIAVSADGVKLNDSADVIKTDIVGSNGVIHAINAVILPPAE